MAKIASDSWIWSAISAIAADFCSRFKRPPVAGFRPALSPARRGSWVASRWELRRGGRALLEDVTCAGRVDFDAGPHRRSHRDRVDVLALGDGRPRLQQFLDHSLVVLQELGLFEVCLADRHVDDRGAV